MIVTGASFYCRIIKIRRSFLLLKKTIYIPGQYIIQDQTQNYRSRKAEWMKEEHKSERDDKVDGPFQRTKDQEVFLFIFKKTIIFRDSK